MKGLQVRVRKYEDYFIARENQAAVTLCSCQGRT